MKYYYIYYCNCACITQKQCAWKTGHLPFLRFKDFPVCVMERILNLIKQNDII